MTDNSVQSTEETVEPTCPTDCFSPAQGMQDISLVLDGVMETLKKHLFEEFNKGRLRGTDYAKVYVGSTEAVLGNTVQYLVGMALTNEQRQKVLADIEFQQKQAEKVEKEIELIDKQIEKMEYEILQVQAQTDLLEAQTNQVNEETTRKLPAEVALLEAQTDKTEADTLLAEEQGRLIQDQRTLKLPIEIEKVTAEKDLLLAKKLTEDGQPAYLAKQSELLDAQKIGFKGKAAADLAKIAADTYAVMRTTDEGAIVPTSLDSTHTDTYVDKLEAVIDSF